MHIIFLQKIKIKGFCGHPTGHNFGHAMDRKQNFLKCALDGVHGFGDAQCIHQKNPEYQTIMVFNTTTTSWPETNYSECSGRGNPDPYHSECRGPMTLLPQYQVEYIK